MPNANERTGEPAGTHIAAATATTPAPAMSHGAATGIVWVGRISAASSKKRQQCRYFIGRNTYSIKGKHAQIVMAAG
jgi:hypothetical protein